jgi:aspartate 1-decarboxylase
MRRSMLKSKIHRALVTDSNLNYEGSISIDPGLCDAAQILPWERVEVYDLNNGERFSTYVIYGKPGEICINGAAARLVHTGDLIIIASYGDYEDAECRDHKPAMVMVDSRNRIQAPPKS